MLWTSPDGSGSCFSSLDKTEPPLSWADRAKIAQAKRAALYDAQDAKVREAIWRRDNKGDIDERGPDERAQSWMVLFKVVRCCNATAEVSAAASSDRRRRARVGRTVGRPHSAAGPMALKE